MLTIKTKRDILNYRDKIILTISGNNKAIDIAKIYEKYSKINKDFSKYLSKDSSGKITIHKAFEIKILSKDNICDFASNFTFENCIFEKECKFEYMVFGDKELAQKKRLAINFKNCEFQSKVYFTNCVFNGEVCFNNSVFKDYADFHESIFNDTASFYNATFESAPNFSTCVFKDIRATNFINVNIKRIDMNSIEKFIGERKADKDYVSDRDLDYKIRYANNARDSFRTIKDVLIANNNLLDASQWHKLELYAKEKELNCLLEHREREYAIRYYHTHLLKRFWLDIKAFLNDGIPNLSLWIDSILLQIYRTTSEHHINFMTILNFTITMIVIQAGLLYIYSNPLKIINDSTIVICNLGLMIFILIPVLLKLASKNTVFSYYTLYIVLFYILIILIILLYIRNTNMYYLLFYLSLQIILIMFVYYFYLCRKTMKKLIIYNIAMPFIYIGFFCVLLLKPVLLNPFIGIFNTDSLIEKRLEQELQNTPNYILVSLTKDLTGQNYIKYCYDCNSAETISIAKNIIRENQNKLLKQNDENHLQNMDYQNMKQAIKYDNLISDIIKTTSIIYSIILLLCVFSLQKTARKNSIIPS